MNVDNSMRCRVTEDEINHDYASRLDEEQGLGDTPQQIISDRVEELMSADSEDDDSIVVLMESERFQRVLRKLLSNRHSSIRCHDALVMDAVNLISVAETELTRWVEVQS